MEIYEPAEDSFLFQKFLENYLPTCNRNSSFLDVGTGSGILAKTACKFFSPKQIVACDINKEAVAALSDQPFSVFESDIFSNIKGLFDIIVCNAPYLPKDSREPKGSQVATTGGKRGDELSLRFLKQAFDYLNPQGKIFLLISSITPLDRINAWKPVIVARKKIDFEELRILEFTR